MDKNGHFRAYFRPTLLKTGYGLKHLPSGRFEIGANESDPTLKMSDNRVGYAD
jgi:hypothetical protein